MNVCAFLAWCTEAAEATQPLIARRHEVTTFLIFPALIHPLTVSPNLTYLLLLLVPHAHVHFCTPDDF